MKITWKMMLVTLVGLGLAFAAFIFSGCGGGDDNTTCATMECPDASQMTADADPTAPDADTTPDANSDPCAPFIGHTDGWQCNAPSSPRFDCDFTLSVQNGQCFILCPAHFQCTTPAPNEMANDHSFTCAVFGGDTRTCYP